MRPSADETVTPPDGERPRPSGQRVIIVAFAAAVLIAVTVILIGVVLIASRGDDQHACEADPAVCNVVRQYAAAFNARDAGAIVGLLTADGLRQLLGVTSETDLAQRLARLTDADRIRKVEISRVNIEGDEATVVARFVREDEGSNAVFSLVRAGGRWRIDR
ncbi:MAG: hypothetical protein WBD55_13225 [Dehalococcoidia bacterium]